MMRARVHLLAKPSISIGAASFALLLGVAACGGTYGGLGEDPAPDATPDALFGTDDGGDYDTSIPDTKAAPPDAAPDAVAETAPDTLVDDVVPEASPDANPDTLVDDAAPDVVAETAPDTLVDDVTPDATPDSAPDTAPDTAPPPILSTNPGLTYCEGAGGANVLCAAGQKCCGTKPAFSGWDWSCTSGSCNAPAFGDSRTYVCNEKADCGGFYCCVDRNFWGTMVGTKCHTDTSGCGDETACMLDSDCPSGKKCKQATAEDANFSLGMCG
jgi:hypothetical protein